jgi:hypothetical protein
MELPEDVLGLVREFSKPVFKHFRIYNHALKVVGRSEWIELKEMLQKDERIVPEILAYLDAYVSKQDAQQQLDDYCKENHIDLFIDTSGETLAKHGYRKIPGAAPMIEALAAATLLASNWNRRGPFVNPMCGSGTIAIEAALLATHRYPGLLRNNYSFMHLKGFDQVMYEKMVISSFNLFKWGLCF